MENCGHPNSRMVSRIHFKLGTGIDHPGGIAWHDSKVKRSRIWENIAITQHRLVLSSSYLEASVRTTPNEWGTKWFCGNNGCLATGSRNLHFMIEYLKNAKVYKLQNMLMWNMGS